MRKIVANAFLAAALMVSGCSDEFRAEDYEPGHNGEPPKALERLNVYTKEFVAEEKNYVLALGEIHAFLITNRLSPAYPSCFSDVLNVLVTAKPENYKKRFPCVALQSATGFVKNTYLSVTVKDVMFNQLDHNNRLTYIVSMFGHSDLAGAFTLEVEPRLLTLYTEASSSNDQVTPALTNRSSGT